ncbi:MAG: alpha/beta hydrolase [Verrucomicrobiota bacterium]
MTEFVLIHGGSHGAWCWSKVIDELEKLGHRGIAFDLPGHGEDFTPRETVTKDSYVEAASRFISELDSNRVVVVAHSIAGMILPDLASSLGKKLKEIIYVAAVVLQKSQRTIDLIPEDRRPSYFEMAVLSEDNSLLLDFDKAYSLFFSDLHEEEARSLYDRLTPQPFAVYLAPAREDPTSSYVPMRYILCTEDRVFPAPMCREWAGALGVPIEEIVSGHDVMLSHPRELANVLMHLRSPKEPTHQKGS